MTALRQRRAAIRSIRWAAICLVTLFGWLCESYTLSQPALAVTCPVDNSSPGFVTGGSVFGFIAAQWNTFFATKVDANNGFACNLTILSGTVPGAFNLSPGLTNQQGTQNNGAATMSAGGRLSPQLYPRTKAVGIYNVNSDNGGVSDSGAVLIATGNTVTFNLPAPSSGTKGISYHVASDGTNGYTLATAAGIIYGCPGPGSGTASYAFAAGIAVTATDDGTNYLCAEAGGGGGSGSSAVAATPQGRLTLTSGTPVMTGDVTAATTVYYDSYVGNQVPVGATLQNLTIGSNEISFGLSTSHVISGSIYDVFGKNNSTILTACIGPAWSSGTSRGTGAGTTQIDRTNAGIYTNTNSLTHCYGGSSGTTDYGTIAAHAGTYLGSFYATANGQTGQMFGPDVGSGGASSIVGLCNPYNNVHIRSVSIDTTATWMYSTAMWRPANNSNLNRISWLDCTGNSQIDASYTILCNNISANYCNVGVSIDAVSGSPSGISGGNNDSASQLAAGSSVISLGFHFAQAMEYQSGGTSTFVSNLGSSGPPFTSGISISMMN